MAMAMADHQLESGRSTTVFAVTVVTISLATIFTFLRMLSRIAVVRKVFVDDYFMVLAWVLSFGLSFACCYGTAWGLGRHEDDIPEEWQGNLRKANYALTVLYQPSLMAIKTSILAFYLTLAKTSRTFKWACIATLVVVNSGGFAMTMLTVFQCRPVHAAFDAITPATAKCTDIVIIYLSSAPLNLITDLAIFFLPMPILTGMRLPPKTKVILIITFSFGIFVAAVDVVRVAYLQSAFMTRLQEVANSSHSGDGRTQDRTDFSWYASYSFMWCAIEVNVGIMVACVPPLKPLVVRFLPSLLRDPDDISTPSHSNSVVGADAALSPVQPPAPALPQEVRSRDFGSGVEPSEEPMDFMDFLTTPDMNEFPHVERSQTARTNTTRNTRPATPTFFDFVNMGGRKSLVHLTTRESLFPVTTVTVIFFIWGFEYGLIDVLNQQFQNVAHMTAGQTISIHSAYFAGYLFGPTLLGRLVLKHWGFKACYAVGLTIYACGTLIYWPAAVLTSFPAFVITNFIVAFGLSILEVAANPFIALCGPPEYAEIRLNISQGVQAIGSVVAPLIANRAFFHTALDAGSLVNTQWAYLGIALITILLAIGYYYVPLPEASDEELEDAAQRIDGANQAKLGNVRIVWVTLGLAVASQFFYVGAQEVNATAFDPYIKNMAPMYDATNFSAIAHTTFAVARFSAALLGIWIKPRILLLGFYIGAIVFEALAMHYSGATGTAMLLIAFFMEGPLFSLIFAQALRGMGRHTKLASVFITASVSGGAVFSPISSAVPMRTNFSLVVAVAAFAAGSLFPLASNLSPLIRAQVDPIKDATVSPGTSRDSSTSSRAVHALTFLHMGAKKRTDSPRADHDEHMNEFTPWPDEKT